MQEPWITLLIDSFLTGTPMPGHDDLAFFVLRSLGEQPHLWLAAAATLGATAGGVVNWLLGRWLRAQEGASWFRIPKDTLAKYTALAPYFAVAMLPLSWAPLGGLFTFLAGFFRVRLGMFLLLAALGRCAYYGV